MGNDVNDRAESLDPDRSEIGNLLSDEKRKLLVFDTSFTLEMVRQRGLEKPILCRDLDGFFDHVWSVHPFATLLTSDDWGPRYGYPEQYRLSRRHTVIEGKVGRFRALRRLFPINFFVAQLDLFLSLMRLVRKERISVIRVPSPLYVGLFGWALARLCRIPVVLRVGANHDELRAYTGKPVEPRLMLSQGFEEKVERFLFPRVDLVAGANQDNLNFALGKGARPERSTVFRYGNLLGDQHFVEPRERPFNRSLLDDLGVGNERFLLSVCRLEATASVKHPDDLIRVLAQIRARGQDVKLMIAGDGRLRAMLVELALELGVQSALCLVGNRDQDWLAQVLPRASVFVSPHAGRALSEAALAAAPVVAYDVDWQREMIKSDETGILVPYRDIDAMVQAVERMLVDRPYASLMGKNLRRRALEMLDPATLNEHERQEYQKLLVRTSVRAHA